MNLPRLSDEELPALRGDDAIAERIKTLMQQAGMPDSTSLYAAFRQFQNEMEHDAVHIARTAAEAQRLKDEQCLREQKPAAYCRPDDPQNSTAFAWPGTDREEGHLAPLYAAPVPASQGDRWLPIETAPKDGTAFLACLDGSDIPVGLRFTATGSLVLTWDGYTVNLIDWPKHWMRIPAAPVATKEAEHG